MSGDILGALAIALVTGAVSLWTQRGGTAARRRSVDLEARAQGLDEFKALREAAMEDVASLRDEVKELRSDVETAHDRAARNASLLDAALAHIHLLHPLIPNPPGAPDLPDALRNI